MLETGIKGECKEVVTETLTAKHVGSGDLDVYATPAMIALMEKTAYTSVSSHLENGQGTVGTYVDVKHISASPIGSNILCKSELIEIENRRLTFEIRVYDDAGLIGKGVHDRFIVNNEDFMEKANNK